MFGEHFASPGLGSARLVIYCSFFPLKSYEFALGVNLINNEVAEPMFKSLRMMKLVVSLRFFNIRCRWFFA